MRELDTHELAWAAGLFDGEGWIGYSPVSSHIRIEIGQSCPVVLHRFKLAVGVGSVRGPLAKKGARKPFWSYGVSNWNDVQAIVALLWKYLSFQKKEQAYAALKGRVDEFYGR